MVQKEEIENWLSQSKKDNNELFAEIDVLLRALDRFFVIDNLTFSHESITAKNFLNELVTVRDTIIRLLSLMEAGMPENRKNLFWFRKFAESKYLSERNRDTSRESLFKQDTQEKGYYLLYDSFVNLKGVTTDLIRTGNISYL
jgi:hypothetical protein